MPENPLLPNTELRALYLLLQSATDLAQADRPRPAHRSRALPPELGMDALLAATLLQAKAGDVVVPVSGDESTSLLLQRRKVKAAKNGSAQVQVAIFGEGSSRLMMAAGLAEAAKRSGTEHLALAFARATSGERQWVEALSWAQEGSLPLVVVCADYSGINAFREAVPLDPAALTWKNLQRVAGKLQLPVLAVDGQDAVAVYRVTQESMLRARARGGPAVIWAILPTERDLRKRLANTASSLDHLAEYLRVRKISLPTTKGVG